jgi:3-keto-disaccharide hydrolase
MKIATSIGWTLAAAVIVIHQSTIESALRGPQSTIESAIGSRQSTVQSALRTPQSTINPQSAVRNPQSAAPSSSPWRALFDGVSMDAWRGYKMQFIPDGWHIADKTLAKDRNVDDLVSKDEFGDFELELEWKIGEAGNSGIFYRGTEEYEHIYWSAPEYQLLDDIKAADNKTRLTCAGALYALIPSPTGHLKQVGDWNTARILARGAHVEHWLNGFKLLEYEIGSPDWEAKVKASKFKDWPNFGRAKKGHIALQGDHSGSLAFRNIRIREIATKN